MSIEKSVFRWTKTLVNGEKREIKNLNITYNVEIQRYFGYIDDLPSLKGIKNHSNNQTQLVFNIEDFINYKNSTFMKINDISEIPLPIIETVKLLGIPKLDGNLNNMTFSGRFDPM